MQSFVPPSNTSTAETAGLRLSTWIIILIISLVVVLSVISFFVTSSILEKSTIAQLDNNLLLATKLAQATLPENYHDSIIDENSISIRQYYDIVKKFDKLCIDYNLEYIWSLMEIDDVIRFSSGTSQNKVEHKNHARFFERHTNPQAYAKAFSTMTAQHTDIVDKWGALRAVLVPGIDSHGRKYLFGAGVRLDTVKDLLYKHFITSLATAGLVGLLGITSALFLTHHIKRSANRLSDGVMKVADGDYGHNIPVTGIQEMRVLAACFNTMSQALSRQVRELENSERKHRELNDNLPQKIFHKNVDLEYVSCNRNYARDLRITPEAIAGKNDFHFYPRELAEKYRADDRQIMESGETVVFEENYVKDGKLYIINTVKTPLKNEQGEVTGILGIFWDITESKKAEEIHRQFIDNLEQVDRVIRRSNNLDDMLKSVLTVVRTILDCDRAWLLYPCDPDVETFHVPIESTKPEYSGAAATNSKIAMTPMIKQDIIDALASNMPLPGGPGNPRSLSMEIPNPFGVQSQMLMAIHPLTGSPWVFGVHQCSHARVWNEQEQKLLNEIGHRLADGLSSMLLFEEQRKSEERFRTLVANIPGVTYHCACDEHWTMDFISDEIENLTGYAAKDFIHNRVRSYASVIHPEDVKLVEDIVKREVERKTAYTLEYRVIHARGEIRWVLERGRGVFDRDDQLLYLDGVIVDITERKEAEQALRRNELKFRAFFDQTFQLIGLLSIDGILLEANRTALSFGEVAASEVLGKPFWETAWWLHSPQQQAKLRKHIAQAASGESVRFEAFFPEPGGETHYLDISIKPIRDESGIMSTLLAEGRDITERKQAEEKLSQAYKELANTKTLMEALLEQSPIPMAIAETSEATLLMINPACRENLMLKNDLIGKSLFNTELEWQTYTADGEEIPAENLPLARAIRGETVNQEPMRVLRKDGSSRWIHVWAGPILDKEGNQIAAQIAFPDITEHKKAEEELAKLRNYLANIIDSMPSVLVGVDADGKVTQWNKTAENETGIAASDAYGKTLVDVFPRMSSEMREIIQSIQTRKPKQQKKQPRQSNGITQYEDVTIYPLVTNGVEGAVIRLDDVTDQVRLEEMIIQSEKMLSVGGLAAGMAHEINNPLAGIMQTANVMEKRLTDKDISANLRTATELGTTMDVIRSFMEKRGILEMLAGINESGKRVAGIVNNMLSFARQSESMTMHCNLSQLIDQALELAVTDYDLKRRYDFKLIKIKKTFDDTLPDVLCEASKIQQVLLNLLRNSAQAMLESQTDNPIITISTQYEKENDTARIEISDNGPGMNEETRKRLFEPFYTTKPVGVGTGLGLSVSYFIITEHHGGEMYAESTPGKGTTMTIRLPIKGKGPRE